MRIINREIQLREETRELEQAKEALTADEYRERSIALYDTQITFDRGYPRGGSPN